MGAARMPAAAVPRVRRAWLRVGEVGQAPGGVEDVVAEEEEVVVAAVDEEADGFLLLGGECRAEGEEAVFLPGIGDAGLAFGGGGSAKDHAVALLQFRIRNGVH